MVYLHERYENVRAFIYFLHKTGHGEGLDRSGGFVHFCQLSPAAPEVRIALLRDDFTGDTEGFANACPHKKEKRRRV